MAKATLNPMFESFHGDIGDLIFRELRGQTIVSRKPNLSGLVPNELQLAHRERFRQAAAYVKAALADPALRAHYGAVAFAKNIPISAVVLGDYLNLPSIVEVDASGYNGQAGGVIKAITKDDIGVVNLSIHIYDADEGTDIENGQAVETPAGSGYWSYTAESEAPAGILVGIEIRATDRPGGEAAQRGTKQI